MRLFLSLCVGLLIRSFSYGQAIENVIASFKDGKAIINYDLVRAKDNQQFSLDLYGSHNNFSSPLKQVSGDVGKNIKAGTAKRIEWNAVAELGSAYKGEITFRVKGDPIPMTLTFKNPASGGSVKKGASTTIQWEGGQSDNIKLELYRGSDRISTIAETKNNGQYNWSVPKDLEKGAYTLKLNAGNESVISGVFTVKSKPPMLLIIGGVAVVGGLVAILAGGGDNGNGNKPVVDPDLPPAPGPN